MASRKKAATKTSLTKKVKHSPQNMLTLKTSLSTSQTTVLLNHLTSKWLLKWDKGHQKQQLIQPLPNSCRGNGILVSSVPSQATAHVREHLDWEISSKYIFVLPSPCVPFTFFFSSLVGGKERENQFE